jgi:hypothetical protein
MAPRSKSSPVRRGSAALAGAVLFLAWLASSDARVLPDPRPADAPATEFSAARARAVLERLLRENEPHPVVSAAHARVLERLTGELRALGLEPQVQDALVAGRNGVVTRVRNVVARIPGTASGPAIALAAHHDSVAAGPGASDDGAGVAALVECARVLTSGQPLEHPLILLITDGEEVDLSGACAFVREHPWAGDVRAVVNLEARGTSGLAYLFQTGPGAGPALKRYAELAPRTATTSTAAFVYALLPNDTDLSVFLDAGWTGLNFAFIDGFQRYHTPLDDAAHLDDRSLQHLGEGALAGVRALDGIDLAQPHGERGERVWHDLLGRVVIGWPRGWSAPLAFGALVLLGLATVRRRAHRRGEPRGAPLAQPEDLVRAAGAGLLGLAAAALAAWSASAILVWIHGVPDPWAAHPGRWDAACILLSAAGALGAARVPEVRGADPRSAFLAIWIGAAFVGCILAVFEPAICPLLVVPAIGAAIVAWTGLSRRPVAFHVAVLAQLAFTALLWFPFLRGVELALGFRAAWVPGLMAGFVAVTAVPLFARAGRTSVRSAAILAAAAWIWLGFTPAYTRESPGWCNVLHVQREDDARWCVQSFGTKPPLAGLALDASASTPLPWSPFPRASFQGAAPRHAEPPPTAEVVELETGDARRRVRVRLASARGASTFLLGFPADRVEVHAIRSGPLQVVGNLPGSSPLVFTGIDAAGVDLELSIRDGPAFAFELADLRPGLPPLVPDARALRPPERVPRSSGDVSIVATRFASARD